MSAAVIASVLIGNIMWAWVAPHVTPPQHPVPVVIVQVAPEVAG